MHLRDVLVVAGTIVALLALTGLLMEPVTRYFESVGLTTALPAIRQSESNHDMQERAMRANAKLLDRMRRRRPVLLIIALVGIALVATGAAL